jgi:hypothetical protein
MGLNLRITREKQPPKLLPRDFKVLARFSLPADKAVRHHIIHSLKGTESPRLADFGRRTF